MCFQPSIARSRVRGEDEAVAEPRRAPISRLDEAAEPDRNRTPWPRVDAGPINVIEAAVEAHERLAPELAQELDLLLLARAARPEILAQSVVLDVIPAYPYPEPQAPSGEQIDICCLPCDERGLPLRQDEDSRDELQMPRERGKVGEHHEGIMERMLFVIRTCQLRLASLVHRAENVIVGEEIVVAERFEARANPTHGVGVAAKLGLRVDGADLHG